MIMHAALIIMDFSFFINLSAVDMSEESKAALFCKQGIENVSFVDADLSDEQKELLCEYQHKLNSALHGIETAQDATSFYLSHIALQKATGSAVSIKDATQQKVEWYLGSLVSKATLAAKNIVLERKKRNMPVVQPDENSF